MPTACLKNPAYLTIAFLAIFVISAPSAALAQNSGIDQAITGVNQSASQGFDGQLSNNGPVSVTGNIPAAIGKMIGAGLAFIGVLFFVLVIYGGFTWMNARGNDADTKKARDIIEAAAIGLIIVLAAYAITAYVSEVLFTG